LKVFRKKKGGMKKKKDQKRKKKRGSFRLHLFSHNLRKAKEGKKKKEGKNAKKKKEKEGGKPGPSRSNIIFLPAPRKVEGGKGRRRKKEGIQEKVFGGADIDVSRYILTKKRKKGKREKERLRKKRGNGKMAKYNFQTTTLMWGGGKKKK